LNADIGAAITQGERLGQIDVLEGFLVRIRIDEHYLPRIDVGQQGEYNIAGKRGQLVVTKLYPEVVENRFEVEARFEGEPPEGVRRGQTLQIRLELGTIATAVLLPKGGFFQSTGGQWAYVLDTATNTAVKWPIKLGRQNPEVFEVLEGLAPGDQVITSSYEGYGDDIDTLKL
jgi:HlyD family secretion protein